MAVLYTISVMNALCKARTCDYMYRNLLCVEICEARSNICDLKKLQNKMVGDSHSIKSVQ